MNYWKFENTNLISDNRFDPLLKKFLSYGLEGLVRENIQNSLDAKIQGVNEPVVVNISYGKMKNNDVPGWHEIQDHVASLKANNEYTQEMIDDMRDFFSFEDSFYMSFEDFNTKGLRGGSEGQLNMKTPYYAYAYGKGIHHEDEELIAEEAQGGSHGVGKIASNAASRLNTMFFANCEENGYKTLGGTISLIEHEVNDEYYRSTGYFTNETREGYFPFENIGFNHIFNKDTRGLKITIPFLRESYLDEKTIVKVVCDSFLLALLSKRLVVNINQIVINQESVIDIVKSDEYFEQTIENIKDSFTPIYLSTIQNHHIQDDFEVYDINRPYLFKLYFQANREIIAGRTGVFRLKGMKIEDRKVKNNVSKPYNAIIIPKSKKEDVFLKSLENESHTELDSKYISSDTKRKNAVRFLNNLDKRIAEVIEEYLDDLTPDSGEFNTEDILYTVENKFKDELRKTQSLVNIGSGKNHKTIVKIKDTKEAGKSKRDHNGKTKWDFVHIDKVKKEFGKEGKKAYFQLPRGRVKRLVIDTTEYLDIDLSGSKYLENCNTGNLLVSLIDGMGKEYQNEYDLQKVYRYAEDINAHKKLDVNEFTFKDVDISNGKIKLQLKFQDNKNSVAKLRYYLEV